eukprot:12842838-Ditylum_brightwellii.AAC.1
MDYCGKIAAPNLLGPLSPPGDLLKGDADANDTPLENCVDTAGEFVVKDEQKCKRFIRSCNWIMHLVAVINNFASSSFPENGGVSAVATKSTVGVTQEWS